MEIISYLKGKKAQKEIKEMHEVIGQDGFKHGAKDVADTFTDADERIGELERQNKDRLLSNKIEKATENAAIQLNKNALRIGSFMNADKFKHTNLVFDDFKDTSGIQVGGITNAIHDAAAHKIVPIDVTKSSSIQLVPESATQIIKLVVETMHSSADYSVLNLDFNTIDAYHQITKSNGSLELKEEKTINGQKVYYPEGYVEFTPIYVEAPLKIQDWLYNVTLKSTDVLLYAALSSDGLTFNPYQLVANEFELKGYVKFKLVLKATEGIVNTNVIPSSAIISHPYAEVVNNQLILRKIHTLNGEKDSTWTDEGSLHRKKITRDEWSKIDKINVVEG